MNPLVWKKRKRQKKLNNTLKLTPRQANCTSKLSKEPSKLQSTKILNKSKATLLFSLMFLAQWTPLSQEALGHTAQFVPASIVLSSLVWWSSNAVQNLPSIFSAPPEYNIRSASSLLISQEMISSHQSKKSNKKKKNLVVVLISLMSALMNGAQTRFIMTTLFSSPIWW